MSEFDYDAVKELLRGPGGGKPPTPPRPGVERVKRMLDADELKDFIMQRDPHVARTGVGSMELRYGLSLADTPEERAAFLDRAVGKGQWTQDMFGRYALMPEAAARFGVQTDKPVTIDEPGLTMGDIADFGGSGPGMVGAMIGGAKGTAVGAPVFPPFGGIAGGILGAGLGAAGGRALQEGMEELQGINLQSASEVAGDVGDEAIQALQGEAVAQGFLGVGRKILAPHAKRITPRARELLGEAEGVGARPAATAVTDAQLMGRMQSMIDTIFGDPRVVRNSAALRAELEAIKSSVGPELLTASEPGRLIKQTIMRGRKALSKWSNSVYSQLSAATNHAAVVPTAGLREAAQDMLGKMPTTRTGKTVLVEPAARQRLLDIMDLPEAISFEQAQGLRSFLWEAVEDRTLLPGSTSGMANRLAKEITKSFDDVVTDPQMRAQMDATFGPPRPGQFGPEQNTFGSVLKRINSRYKARVSQFDDALVARIARDPKFAGAIDPESVVGAVFKPKSSGAVTRVMSLMKKGTRMRVRRAAMEDLMGSYIKNSPDPMVGQVFDGTSLLNKLDDIGDETLTAMFGEATKNRLYRLGRVTQFASKKPGQSGGLVAANIALHPIQNLPKLIQLKIVSNFLMSEPGFRWATEGLKAPKTRAGSAALTRMSAQLAAMADQFTAEELQ